MSLQFRHHNKCRLVKVRAEIKFASRIYTRRNVDLLLCQKRKRKSLGIPRDACHVLSTRHFTISSQSKKIRN